MCDNCRKMEEAREILSEPGEDTPESIRERLALAYDAGGHLIISTADEAFVIQEALKTQANSYPGTLGGERAAMARDSLLQEGINVKPETMIK